MATGRQNRLAGQIAEHLVCAELGRRGLIATPFAGNVPTFDVIAADAGCRTIPIQVKATRSDNWPTDARDWMELELDATGLQRNGGPRRLENSDLVYVCVALHPPMPRGFDRFFILTKSDVQLACIESYERWMESHGWRRPRNPASYDCRFHVRQLERFENDWQLITKRLAAVGT